MSTFMKFIMALSLSTFLIGCDQGPAEEAGEKIDNAVDNVQDSAEDACEDVSDENC